MPINPNVLTDKEQFVFDAGALRLLWNAIGEPGNFNADFMPRVKQFAQSRNAATGGGVAKVEPTAQPTDAQIARIALANGFTLKQQPDGKMALNPYVFDFARALMAPPPVAGDVGEVQP